MSFNEWLQQRWRPATAVVYLIICMMDFVFFPICWSLFLYFAGADELSNAWEPMTLKGAGMFHLSFGAILGVSAYTRGREKVEQVRRDIDTYSRSRPSRRERLEIPDRPRSRNEFDEQEDI